jgi:hypothetical protein
MLWYTLPLRGMSTGNARLISTQLDQHIRVFYSNEDDAFLHIPLILSSGKFKGSQI